LGNISSCYDIFGILRETNHPTP